jgi:hypothetical protein
MLVTLFSKLNQRASVGLKLMGTALALVACEPFNPMGTCENSPPCEQRDYSLKVTEWKPGNVPFDSTHTDSLPILIRLSETSSPEIALLRGSVAGGGARAYALSCGSCTDGLRADSILFSTDIVTSSGDTLKAGYNFTTLPLPTGFVGYGYSTLRIDSLTGFRDSTFQIRFYARSGKVQKSDSLVVTIRNPDLLLK